MLLTAKNEVLNSLSLSGRNFCYPAVLRLSFIILTIKSIPSFAHQNIAVDRDGDGDGPVDRDDPALDGQSEDAEGNVLPYQLGVVEKDAQQNPDVGHTVEEDHAVDIGRGRPVPDIGRENFNMVSNSSGLDQSEAVLN